MAGITTTQVFCKGCAHFKYKCTTCTIKSDVNCYKCREVDKTNLRICAYPNGKDWFGNDVMVDPKVKNKELNCPDYQAIIHEEQKV